MTNEDPPFLLYILAMWKLLEIIYWIGSKIGEHITWH